MHARHKGPARWGKLMMYGERPPPPLKGSKPVSLLFRLCAMLLAAASGIVMVASSECAAPSSGDATVASFTYARFGAFVFLVRCMITATIIEAAAFYLHLTADKDDYDYKPVMEKEDQRTCAARIVLVVVDLLVPALLFPAMTAAYMTADFFGDQIGACALFAGQVEHAKILSLAACVTFTVAVAFRPRLK
uniref:Uncharacterized protein n=1 Tax=Avena sativa TaxID=4498 RepID=A0ACD5WCM4_AVESA